MAWQHPRTIASRRVSTHEQDVAKNQTDILLLAHRQQLGQVQFVDDTVSGRVPWRRRKIAQVLDTLEAGATLVVSELSRLGRRMLECAEILALATQKGLHLHAVKGDWQLDGGELASLAQAARHHPRPGLTSRPLAVAGPGGMRPCEEPRVQHWRVPFLGLQAIPPELTDFEIRYFVSYTAKERAAIFSR